MTDFVPLPISPDLDRGYNARASVASFDVKYAKYVAASARVKAECSFTTHVYDQVSGEKLDLYPAEHGAPLFLWIHGGYWRASSKDDNAFVVPGLLNHSVSVAVLDYTLAPAVTLDEIVRQVRTAFAFLHSSATDLGYDGRRIHIGGSSAGGHLTGMLLAGGWGQAFGVPEDSIGIAMPLSGLFELDPLRSTHINQWMRLGEAAARRNSPIQLIPPGSKAQLLASVGGLETTNFRQQTIDYVTAWHAAGNTGKIVEMPSHNHFDIALSLGEADGVLASALVKAIGRI